MRKPHKRDRRRAQRNGMRGKEYWKSRLFSGGEPLGKEIKIMTHRKERRAGKSVVREMENEP